MGNTCSCPHCGTEYQIEASEFGRYVTCQSCKKGFVVGQNSSRGSEEAQASAGPQVVVKKSRACAVFLFLIFIVLCGILLTLMDVSAKMDRFEQQRHNDASQRHNDASQIYRRMGEMKLY